VRSWWKITVANVSQPYEAGDERRGDPLALQIRAQRIHLPFYLFTGIFERSSPIIGNVDLGALKSHPVLVMLFEFHNTTEASNVDTVRGSTPILRGSCAQKRPESRSVGEGTQYDDIQIADELAVAFHTGDDMENGVIIVAYPGPSLLRKSR
jgi:hypothetical protein